MRSGAAVPAAAGGELGRGARRTSAETSKDPDVLEVLAGDGNHGVRWGVAENPNTPVATLGALARDGHYGVRQGVAGNLNTPAGALVVLAADENYWVRQGVASNPSAPAAALEALARDEDYEVRQLVASNPNAPAAVLELLAGDGDPVTRREAAENPSAPISVVAELMGDPALDIASTARDRFTSWAQETLDLGSAPTGQLIDMLVTLKAWELDPQDPAVAAAVVLCN